MRHTFAGTIGCQVQSPWWKSRDFCAKPHIDVKQYKGGTKFPYTFSLNTTPRNPSRESDSSYESASNLADGIGLSDAELHYQVRKIAQHRVRLQCNWDSGFVFNKNYS